MRQTPCRQTPAGREKENLDKRSERQAQTHKQLNRHTQRRTYRQQREREREREMRTQTGEKRDRWQRDTKSVRQTLSRQTHKGGKADSNTYKQTIK